MEQIKTIIKMLISLTTTPEQTWSYLAERRTDESDVEENQWHYYFPWLVIASAIVLVLNTLHAYSNDLDHESSAAVATGMRQMVPFLVSYFAAPYVTVALLRELYPFCMQFQIEKRRLEIFVRYAMSFVILVEVFCSLLSHIRLVTFVAVYLVYIVWAGAGSFARVNDKQRWMFTVITSSMIYLLPVLLSKLLYFLIR